MYSSAEFLRISSQSVSPRIVGRDVCSLLNVIQFPASVFDLLSIEHSHISAIEFATWIAKEFFRVKIEDCALAR
jgi:hypothetical protein